MLTAAPAERATLATSPSTAGSVSSVGVSTQARPSKRSCRPETAPERSRPAIGWDPQYRARSAPEARSSSSTTPLTDATSVTAAVGQRRSASPTQTAVTSGGVATTTRSGSTGAVGHPPRPEVAGQCGVGGADVLERDVVAEAAQRQAEARSDEAGPDDVDPRHRSAAA